MQGDIPGVIAANKNRFAGPDLNAEWDALQARKTALLSSHRSDAFRLKPEATGHGAEDGTAVPTRPGRRPHPAALAIRASGESGRDAECGSKSNEVAGDRRPRIADSDGCGGRI